MKHLCQFLGAATLTSMLGACAVDESPTESDDLEYRCATIPVGIIGLELVDVAGSAKITGSAFSNVLVTLAGAFEIDGAAISGGQVSIAGSRRPSAGAFEHATTVEAPDPTADVAAARLHNDNARIPCIPKGNRCVSPVSAGVLTLNATQRITLTTGTYYLEGIRINGQAQLDISGAVVIYLDGDAAFNGGSATNPASDTLSVISASTADIKLTGRAEATMRIFAPFATVRFSGTHGFRGGAIGRVVRVTGTADLLLTEDMGGPQVGCDGSAQDAGDVDDAGDAGDGGNGNGSDGEDDDDGRDRSKRDRANHDTGNDSDE